MAGYFAFIRRVNFAQQIRIISMLPSIEFYFQILSLWLGASISVVTSLRSSLKRIIILIKAHRRVHYISVKIGIGLVSEGEGATFE